ncbi:unnamed protein product [Rhizoctonia solani]|uniref:Uncharacterized protein n=1 Tax=Rhizoctonia solani TaxID=456999 RepID=A0A8H3DIT0_9AGAM|nr:unnamed protein product [Rhizoctonia solani]
MEHIPLGAIAAANSLNGDRLKVVMIGEGGAMHDVDCRFGHEEPRCAHLMEQIPLPIETSSQVMHWTEGGIVGLAHPYSKLAACTVERLNLACFFYQLPDSSIVMRRCRMEPKWEWESNYIPVLSVDGQHSPGTGTNIVVQPSVLRAEDDPILTLFYQTASGNIEIQRLTDSGELHGPLFQGRLSIPRFTPFTALTSGNKFTISYITPGDTKEIWECSGSVGDVPWHEFEDEIWECSGSVGDVPWHEFEDGESYISAAQRLVLQNVAAPEFVQMASYHGEHPIFCCMTSGPPKSIVWSSAQARRSYYFEDRGTPGTPVALAGWVSMWSSLAILFVDINGTVNIGRLESGSSKRTKQPGFFPIPLDSMRSAFSWVLLYIIPSTFLACLGEPIRAQL